MTWLSDLSNRVTGKHQRPPKLEILAFEVARTMSRLLSLYKSLSDDEIAKLRKEVVRSQGVAYLNSMDERFLLKLAGIERIEELDGCAVSVARFGKKCSDPSLTQFEFAYADLKLGFMDLAKLDFASKEIGKTIEKMEKFTSATSSLYAELESLSELEALEKKTKRWKDHSGPIPMHKPKNEFSEQNMILQRQLVQHFKDVSLWNQPFNRMVGLMARTVCVLYARICAVFSPYISVLPTVSSRHVRFSSLHWQYEPRLSLDEEDMVKTDIIAVTSRSGPLTRSQIKQTSGFVRFISKDLKPVAGENIGFHIGIKDKHELGFGWVEKTTTLVQQAPPTTVGGNGLSLRYADLIIQLEKYLESPSSVTATGRKDLYDMLPENLKIWVNSKLHRLYRNQNEFGWWDDEALAEGWRDGLKVIMGWLAPVARDTVKWMTERKFEKEAFEAKPTVLLLQTLFFADKEKTEAAIVEVLVGLSCICRYEFNRTDVTNS